MQTEHEQVQRYHRHLTDRYTRAAMQRGAGKHPPRCAGRCWGSQWRWVSGLLLLLFLLSGCVQSAPPQTSPEPATATPPSTTIPTAAPTAIPTAAPTATISSERPVISADNLAALRPLRELGQGRALQAAFAPNGRMLAVGTSSGLLLYELPTLRQLRFDPIVGGVRAPVQLLGRQEAALAFSPDSTTLAVALARSERTELRQVADGATLAVLDGGGPIFSPDGRVVATLLGLGSGNSEVQLWNRAEGTAIAKLPGVQAVFSPDGALLATVQDLFSAARTRIWRSADGTALLDLAGYSPAFSPDGRSLATASDAGVQRWQLPDGAALETIPLAAVALLNAALTFSPDGQRLYAAAGSELLVWNVAEQQPVASFSGVVVGDPPYLRFAPAGAALLNFNSGLCVRGGAQLINPADGRVIFSDETSVAATFSVDGQMTVLLGYDGRVRLLDLAQGSSNTLELPGFVAAAFSSEGEILAIAAPQASDAFAETTVISLTRVADGAPLGIVQGGTSPLELSFGPSERWLALESGSGCEGLSATVTTWDANASDPARERQALAVGPTLLLWDYSPASDIAAWWSEWEGLVQLQSSDGITTTLSSAAMLTALVFSPDGRMLAIGDDKGAVQLFTLDSANLVQRQRLEADGAVVGLTFSLDGSLVLARRADGTLLIWQSAAPATPRIITAALADQRTGTGFSRSDPRDLLISPDNQLLIAATAEGIAFYRLEDGQLLQRLDLIAQAITIDPSGRYLAAISDERVVLWGE